MRQKNSLTIFTNSWRQIFFLQWETGRNKSLYHLLCVCLGLPDLLLAKTYSTDTCSCFWVSSWTWCMVFGGKWHFLKYMSKFFFHYKSSAKDCLFGLGLCRLVLGLICLFVTYFWLVYCWQLWLGIKKGLNNTCYWFKSTNKWSGSPPLSEKR